MTANTVNDLRNASSAAERLVAGIPPDAWAAPTPCTEWDVRALLNHFTAGNLLFASIITGAAPPDRTADHLGGNPAEAFAASCSALCAAFEQPSVLESQYQGPFGVTSGKVLLQLRITESLLHGWDIARATDQSTDGLASLTGLVEQALAFAQDRMEGRPRTHGMFGPAHAVPRTAPALDRLIAFMGRPLDWSPGVAASLP